MKSKEIFRFNKFSRRQLKVLTWWHDGSLVNGCDGIIADGAIRSGKTLSMSLSFVFWAMERFTGKNFGMCGKTIGTFRRNVLVALKLMLRSRGFRIEDRRSDNLMIVRKGGTENYFYIFGGKDERSQDLVQGATLAGVFFDEVALMPESFVNQATGRCSVDGSKFWFNCNPDRPDHWFHQKWILSKEKNLLYLHFTMDDNPSLTERIKARYRAMYSGVFYTRYILGLWAVAEGLIYPMFGDSCKAGGEQKPYEKYYISMDYGVQNATAMLLWGLHDGVWEAVREYYHSGRETNEQKTDQQYYNELEQLAGDLPIKNLIIDPSATSFIALCNQKKRFKVWRANNDVIDGIRHTATCLAEGKIRIGESCSRTIKEFGLYRWDEKSSEDRPVKENDHAMDAVRYFVNTTQIWREKKPYTPILNYTAG